MSVNLEEAVLVKGGKIFTGRAGQTKASGITFDGTGSDIVSTDVEDAIKEVNGKKANESLIATVQTSLTASRAYSAGEQFVYNGLLYKFTTSCAQGGTITIGGNCALADSVTAQIKGLVKYADQTLTFTNGAREVTNISTTWGLSNVNLFINFLSLTRGYNITWSYYGGKLYMIVSNATSYTGDLNIRVIYV